MMWCMCVCYAKTNLGWWQIRWHSVLSEVVYLQPIVTQHAFFVFALLFLFFVFCLFWGSLGRDGSPPGDYILCLLIITNRALDGARSCQQECLFEVADMHPTFTFTERTAHVRRQVLLIILTNISRLSLELPSEYNAMHLLLERAALAHDTEGVASTLKLSNVGPG